MAPFEYRPYQSREWTGSLADIIAARGHIPAEAALRTAQIQADATRAKGQVWGGAVQQIGQAVGQAVQQIGDARNTATIQGLIKSTPKVDLGDGVLGYDLSAISEAIVAKGGDPSQLMSHLAPLNQSLQQLHAGRVATVQRGAQGLLAAGGDPMLAGDFFDLLEQNKVATPEQLRSYRSFATTPEKVMQLATKFAGPQKVENAAPGSMARNSYTGQLIHGSQVPEKAAPPGQGDYTINGQRFKADGTQIGAPVPTQPSRGEEETRRHNKAMEEIGKMTAGRAAAAQAEAARHNRATEAAADPFGLLGGASGPPATGDAGYGRRFNNGQPGGAFKGDGFLGPLQRPDGSGVMSEYSIGVQIGGKETEIPTLVPTLTKQEVQTILTMKEGDKMPDSIVQKAVDFAKQRMAAGKDPFAGPGEQQALYPDLKRAAAPAPGAQTAPLAPGTGDAVLSRVPPQIASQVKALAEGRMAFPTGNALRSSYWQSMMSLVARYDPSFDAVNYNARSKTRSDFTSGKSAQTINALNTVAQHLDRLSTAADALNNNSWTSYNTLANFLSRQSGSKTVTNFETDKKAVVDELTRAWRQAGGSEGDIKSWSSVLDAANSPEQLHGAIGEMGHLLEGKLTALESQFKQGMGAAADIPVVTPQARAVLSKLEQKASHGAALSTPQERTTKPIDGYPGTEQTYRNGKWIRTK